jgi:hypothetical protein
MKVYRKVPKGAWFQIGILAFLTPIEFGLYLGGESIFYFVAMVIALLATIVFWLR